MELKTCLIALLASSTLAAAGPPRGSITIERIAEIKYPSEHAWSPDARRSRSCGTPPANRTCSWSSRAGHRWR